MRVKPLCIVGEQGDPCRQLQCFRHEHSLECFVDALREEMPRQCWELLAAACASVCLRVISRLNLVMRGIVLSNGHGFALYMNRSFGVEHYDNTMIGDTHCYYDSLSNRLWTGEILTCAFHGLLLLSIFDTVTEISRPLSSMFRITYDSDGPFRFPSRAIN